MNTLDQSSRMNTPRLLYIAHQHLYHLDIPRSKWNNLHPKAPDPNHQYLYQEAISKIEVE